MADPAWLQELFATLDPVQVKRMFGGQGVFHEGLMIALVADEQIYLKTDSESQHSFEALGLEPFRYQKGNKLVALSYFQAPEALYEDPEEARPWCQSAWQAAVRSHN